MDNAWRCTACPVTLLVWVLCSLTNDCNTVTGFKLPSHANVTPLSPWQPPLTRFRRPSPVCQILQNIFDTLRWTSALIIQDDFGRQKWPLVDILDFRRPLTVYEYYLHGNVVAPSIERILHNSADPYGPRKRFVLFCSLDCITAFLKLANGHDSRADEQGVFTFKDTWLLVLSRSHMREVERVVGNVSHVTAFIYTDPVSTQYSGTGDTRSTMGLSALDIYSVFWTSEGRRFQRIGWTRGSWWHIRTPFFPNTQYGFNGRTFTVTTNMWEPFVRKSLEGNASEYSGFCLTMLNALAESLNFSYVLVEPPDGGWGELENNTWNGLVLQLLNKEVDICVAPLAISWSRESVVDFTYPFYSDSSVVLYRLPDARDGGVYLFLKPFKLAVWVGLVASVLLVGLVMYVFWRLGLVCDRVDRDHPRHPRPSPVADPPRALWMTMEIFLCQGVPVKPSQGAVRLVFGLWCAFCMIVGATYSGNLIAFLAISRPTIPFRTLAQLAETSSYKIGTLGSTVWADLFQGAEGGVYRKIWQKMELSATEGVDPLNPTNQVHLDLVRRGSYAYVLDGTGASSLVANSCQYTVMEETFYPLYNAVALQNNSAYRDVFSEAILKLHEGGLFTRWQYMHWPTPRVCGHGKTDAHALSIDDVKGVFVSGGILLLLSVLVLAVEQLPGYKRRESVLKNKTRRQPNGLHQSR